MARACSPRVELHGDRVVVFDASGLGRVIGSPEAIGHEVMALAMGQGVAVRVALAPSRVAAWLLAHAQPGVTVVDEAQMKARIGALPLDSLRSLGASPDSSRSAGTGRDARQTLETEIDSLRRWGLKTLSQVAALTSANVAKRFNLPKGRIEPGADADLVLVDLRERRPPDLQDRHKLSPFAGRPLPRIVRTLVRGGASNGRLITPRKDPA